MNAAPTGANSLHRDVLEGVGRARAALCRGHRLHERRGGGERRDAADAAAGRLSPHAGAVASGGVAVRGVDDEAHLALGHEVDDVGMTLADAPDHAGVDAAGTQRLGGASRGHDVVAQVCDRKRDRRDRALVAVADRDEHGAVAGHLVLDGLAGLGVRLREGRRDAHDLAGRLHLGPEHGVCAREARPGHDGLLHGVVAAVPRLVGEPEACDLLASHDLGGRAGQAHAGGLGREGHGPACARVELDDVDLLVLHGVLDVEKALDADGEREAARGLADALDDRVGEREGREAAGGVAGVDAALLDVLEDGADVAGVAVAEGVDVELDGVLEEGVEVDGVVGRDLGGLGHVAAQVGVVVDDRHAAPAQHIAGAHEQREADRARDAAGVVEGLGRGAGRVGDLEAVEQAREAVAVLGEVDGLGLGAHDLDAGRLEAVREVDGRLAAERDDDALGLLGLHDVHHVLEGERLEVEAVGGVVVGRDRLGVAVDHDRLEAARREGVARVDAAVVELDALADAVGARREDQHARPLGVRALGGAAGLVGQVVVARAGRKLAEIHLNYETAEPYRCLLVSSKSTSADLPLFGLAAGENRAFFSAEAPETLYKVRQMRFAKKQVKVANGKMKTEDDKTRIVYNDKITIAKIPLEAYEYVVNGKSAIEWIMERYAVTTDKASGIVNDPNDWALEHNDPKYIFNLVLRIITVSLETMKIVKSLPKVKF